MVGTESRLMVAYAVGRKDGERLLRGTDFFFGSRERRGCSEIRSSDASVTL